VILNALVERLKRRSKDDFKGRHFEALLILQAVSWYLRYPLSYRDTEELFLERGLAVDHSTLDRWVLAYARRDGSRQFIAGAQDAPAQQVEFGPLADARNLLGYRCRPAHS
jgi:hypothetical protein